MIFEYPQDEESELISLVKKNMENALSLIVPLKVDFGVGLNWYGGSLNNMEASITLKKVGKLVGQKTF